MRQKRFIRIVITLLAVALIATSIGIAQAQVKFGGSTPPPPTNTNSGLSSGTPAGVGVGVGPYQVGDAVMVKWKGSWWPAHVLQVAPKRWYINYDGYSSSWDEWVGPGRIRPR